MMKYVFLRVISLTQSKNLKMANKLESTKENNFKFYNYFHNSKLIKYFNS